MHGSPFRLGPAAGSFVFLLWLLGVLGPAAGRLADRIGWRRLAFSALKESEDGEWLVARCVNLLAEPVRGRWKFGFPVREAQLARLDETPLKKIKIADGAVAFEAGASAIVTLLLR